MDQDELNRSILARGTRLAQGQPKAVRFTDEQGAPVMSDTELLTVVRGLLTTADSMVDEPMKRVAFVNAYIAGVKKVLEATGQDYDAIRFERIREMVLLAERAEELAQLRHALSMENA